MSKGRAPCCDKSRVKRGPWSSEEDLKLITHIQQFGHANWRALPAQAGLLRCGKSCRLRWINYLRPDIKRGNITVDEERTIINLHKEYGNKWSKIASHLPGRTDNEIKNVWNTHLKKKCSEKDKNTKITYKNKKYKKSSQASASASSSSSATSAISMSSCSNQHEDLKDELRDVASPSISFISNAPSFNQGNLPSPQDIFIEFHDEMFKTPAELDLDIWYMIEGMGPIISPYNNVQNLELNTYQDASFGNKIFDRDVSKHLQIEMGLEITSEENHPMELLFGSPCNDEIRKIESSSMAYLV